MLYKSIPPYSTFQVLGGSNRAEAIHEIRSRMRGIAGAIPTPQVTEPAPTSVPPVAKPAPRVTTSDDTSKDSESFSFFSKP